MLLSSFVHAQVNPIIPLECGMCPSAVCAVEHKYRNLSFHWGPRCCYGGPRKEQPSSKCRGLEARSQRWALARDGQSQ